MPEGYIRVPIIDKDRCRPDKCNFECGLICVVNRQGKQCITLVDIEDVGNNPKINILNKVNGNKKKIAKVDETMCVNCSMCAKSSVCPFQAVTMANIPTELTGTGIHRYGQNGFRMYKMPILKPNQVTGLLGQNGIGKSTIVNILANKLKPNFENASNHITDLEIIAKFKGNEMHKYMTRLYNNELKVSVKPQHVDGLIPYLKKQKTDPTVQEYLLSKIHTESNESANEWYNEVVTFLELDKLYDSKVLTLSGGELQRLICATTLLSKSDVYIFDEPTNYLDVKKRLDMAFLINKLVKPDIYVLVIEHDLTILDYMSDYVCIMYGTPGAFGITSLPMSTSNAINTYFDGYIQAENMRFRQSEYSLMGLNVPEIDEIKNEFNMDYEGGIVEFDHFKLDIVPGSCPDKSSITIILGENGSGKTTFINHLANQLGKSVSHKPQYLSIENFKQKDNSYPTVRDFLMNNIMAAYLDQMFVTDVIKPMNIANIADRKLDELSGGELQRFFIVYCLGQNTHIYLIDEPSSMLDIEQRVITAKVLKRFAVHNKKILFVVEHDMMIAVSLGSELNSQVVFMDVSHNSLENQNKKTSIANKPTKFSEGINHFLKNLNITFRTDTQLAKHKRPRINKLNSTKDKEQKSNNKYYD